MQPDSAHLDTASIGYANGNPGAGDAILLAQTRMLRKNARTALLANCILAGAVTYVMRGAVEAPVLFAWLAILLGLNGARFLHIAASRAAADEFDAGVPWARWFTLGAGLTGAVWGIGAVIMFPPDAIQLQVFLAFVAGGLAAGGVVMAASWLPAYFAFVLPMLAPLIFRFLIEPGELPLVMGAMLILFVVFLGSLARSFNASLKQTLSLSSERSRLLDERNTNDIIFLRTFHNSPVLMTLSDPKDGRHYDVNRAWTALTGYSHQDAMGKSSLQLELWANPEDRAAFIEALERDGEVAGIETRFRTRDGAERDMLVAGEYVRDGGVNKLLFIGQDITRLKEVERLKTEFVSVVSHELRTPLTSIKGSLGLISKKSGGDLSEQSRELLELAERNTDRLTNLVNDILDFEKLRSGAMRFQSKRFDLAALAADTIAECRGFAATTGVTFHMTRATQPVNVTGDAMRIGQVIANILSNAAKFSEPGGTVEISVYEMAGLARAEISDRGPGIDAGLRGAIFERFTQGDQSDTRAKMGTGLGLSISKSIIDQHGGHIDFRANDGGGTTFFFVLPMVR
jgi:PAS domain S-box-containing protein